MSDKGNKTEIKIGGDVSGVVVGGNVEGDIKQNQGAQTVPHAKEESGPWRVIGRIALIAGIIGAVAAVIALFLS